MRTAFVLAGGGTKGAFEVGAVRHLVGPAAIVPEVITAASAGSIIGATLAQARGIDELRARAADLGEDLVAMSGIDVVFGRQPWLEELRGTEVGERIMALISRRPDPPVLDEALPGDAPAGQHELPGPVGPPAAPDARRHHRAGSLRRIAGLLGDAGDLVRATHHLRGGTASFLTLDPLGAALRGEAPPGVDVRPLDPELVARPGVDLRLAVTALDAGALRYVTGDGTVVEADARTPSPSHRAPVDLVEAVLTSSSAPLVFPPRALGGRAYADGGIVANLPTHAAVALGAERVVAVVATTLDAPVDHRTVDELTLVDVHLRASELMFFDQQRRSLDLPSDVALDVVAPTVDVVGAFEVEEGLLRIDMDYGWLRAQEALAGLDAGTEVEARRLTDRIVVARDRAWFAEELVASGQPGADGDDVARCKAAVATALDRRRSLGLEPPPGAEAWASEPELHATS